MKRFMTIILVSFLLILLMPIKTLAANDVVLNSTNFPDPLLLTFVKQYDRNRNGILEDNDNELKRIRVFHLRYFDSSDPIYSLSEEVKDLRGVKYLKYLEEIALNWSGDEYMNVTELDVSGLPYLTRISWMNINVKRNLQSLNASNCPNLEEVTVANNKLTSLNLQNSTSIKHLDCRNNNLTTLNINTLSKLETISCDGNILTSLDLSGNPEITVANCSNNQLKTINLNNNKKLDSLSADHNNLSTLDIASCIPLKENLSKYAYTKKERDNYILYTCPGIMGASVLLSYDKNVNIITDRTHLVKKFVERLYTKALNRNAEASGLQYWTNQLVSRSNTAAQAVQGFFNSKEFLNAKHSDEEFLNRAYLTMLDRKPDKNGKKYWLDKIKKGVSRDGVLKGFVDSNEFIKLCNDYGIERGTIVIPVDKNKLSGFVTRLYTKALGRKAETSGLNYWVNKIASSAKPRQEAHNTATNGFFHSQEFLNKKINNSDFVKILYRTFLDREYDKGGYEYWLKKLNAGESRDSVIAGFANSKEFSTILDTYGLYQ